MLIYALRLPYELRSLMRVAYLWPSATEHSFAVYTLRVLSNRFAHYVLRTLRLRCA